MKVLVAMCFVKQNGNCIDTEINAEIIEATNQNEAVGILLRNKPNDRHLGAFSAKEIL